MVEEKKQTGWGGPRTAGPGKTEGRPTNESRGLPTGIKKQFVLYPADIAILEDLLALLPRGEGNGSAVVRGLLRQAVRLSEQEMAEVVEVGKL